MNKRLCISACLALVALALVATTAQASPAQSAVLAGKSAGTTTTITVGIVPVVNSAALFLGLRERLFLKNGLTVKVVKANNGPALAAAIVSGQVQFGITAPIAALNATNNHIPVEIVAAATSANLKDNNALVVAANSPITSIKQLEGKKVGVQALKSGPQVVIEADAKALGADPSKLQFVQVPTANVPALLQTGQIDAGWLSEPFLTAALSTHQVKELVARPNHFAVGSNRPLTTVWITGTSWAKSHPDVVRAFIQSMKQSNASSDKHPKALRAVLSKFTALTSDQQASVLLPYYPRKLSVSDLATWGKLMVEYGLTSTPPSIPNAVYHR